MQTGGVVQCRFAVVVAARQSGGGGEGYGVQTPIGANAHPPGGFLLDLHTPS